MTLYCGIDLYSNNSVISLIDETVQSISEKRLENNLEAIEHYPARISHQAAKHLNLILPNTFSPFSTSASQARHHQSCCPDA